MCLKERLKKNRLLDIDGCKKGIYEKVKAGSQSDDLSPHLSPSPWKGA